MLPINLFINYICCLLSEIYFYLLTLLACLPACLPAYLLVCLLACFPGGCSFYIKNKLKTEVFNVKNFINKIFFSIITKNLNWEISTKNLILFKRWDKVKKNGRSLKNAILRGGIKYRINWGVNYLKRGG